MAEGEGLGQRWTNFSHVCRASRARARGSACPFRLKMRSNLSKVARRPSRDRPPPVELDGPLDVRQQPVHCLRVLLVERATPAQPAPRLARMRPPGAHVCEDHVGRADGPVEQAAQRLEAALVTEASPHLSAREAARSGAGLEG